MPLDINQFMAQLEGDGARPNLFQVIMPLPAGLANASTAQTKLTFLIRSAQLPGVTQGQIPLYYAGREVKVPGNKTFADWTVNVINDEDFAIRNFFETWSNAINSHEANVRDPAFPNLLSLSTDATVNQLDKQGNVIKSYTMVGLWPMDIAPIELDQGANDQIEEFTIVLSLQYWTSNTTS